MTTSLAGWPCTLKGASAFSAAGEPLGATPEGFVRTYGDVSPGAPRVGILPNPVIGGQSTLGHLALESGAGVEGVDPTAAALLQVVGQAPVADRAGDLGGAVVRVRQVERVRDRMDHAVLEEVLAVEPARELHRGERPAGM